MDKNSINRRDEFTAYFKNEIQSLQVVSRTCFFLYVSCWKGSFRDDF